MPRSQPKHSSGAGLILRKYFLSAFVVISFAAYTIHERFGASDTAHAMIPTVALPITQPTSVFVPTPTTSTSSALGNSDPPQNPPPTNTPGLVVPANVPPTDVQPTDVPPTAVPPSPTIANSLYRDGTYTGDVADAFYGNVQVQATIQRGQITNVKFLDYPHDRRTSQYINSQAMPWLQTEAVQAQNANVNLISGATLTSEAFVQSLQTALSKAHS